MKFKYVLTFLLVLCLITPSIAQARSFGGGSSRSYSSSRSSSYSKSSSSYSGSSSRSSSRSSSWFGGSSKKSSTTRSSGSFSGGSSKKYSSSSYKSKSSFSGATSKKSYVSGRTYSGRSSTAHVGGKTVVVNHYYHAGYSPSGWFGYYHGFTMGMFMSSLWHPWGYTYMPMGAPGYVSYGPSPIAWVVDIIGLIILLIIIIAVIKAIRPSKTYTRRF